MSNMNNIAQRQKRNTLRDVIVGAIAVTFAVLVGSQAVAFNDSHGVAHQKGPAVEQPVPTQLENANDPDELICTPESLSAVC